MAGRVKTRLAGDIGTTAATAFYRHTCQGVIARLSATSLWTTILNIAPDAAVSAPFWPHNLTRTAQGEGDLGQRMRRAMTWFPSGPVVLVGTDIPAIQRHHIADAFNALRKNDFVLGPTPDGGFWLVGTANQRNLEGAFDNVRWSTEFALQDTINGLKSHSFRTRIGLVAELNDIDHGSNLAAARSFVGRRILPSQF